MNLINNFRTWVGEGRFWTLIGVFVTTGIGSLVVQISGVENAIVSQNALAGACIVSIIVIVGSAMDVEQRGRYASILIPSFGLVLLGVVFFPDYLVIFMGAAFGWALIGLILFGRSSGAPLQYRQAIKAMRDFDYKTAVDAMDDLIKEDNDDPNHYRFRAELLRLWGKLGRARRDYQAMLNKSISDEDRAVAYNGIAEVDLQAGNYNDALQAAQHAYELAPDEWVAAYNLGMIADRLGDADLAIDSLEKALKTDIPDSRHRLLVHLWQARAYARQKKLEQAEQAIGNLKKEEKGLREWQKILPDEQAKVLREVLEADVSLADALIKGDGEISRLTKAPIT